MQLLPPGLRRIPKGAPEIPSAATGRRASDLATTPPSDDEILRARKPILERWQRQLRENGSWSSLVAEAQSRPELLERRRTRAAVLEAITPADLTAAAKHYLDPAKAVEVRIVPAG